MALTFLLHFSVLNSCIALLCGITFLPPMVAAQFGMQILPHKETKNKHVSPNSHGVECFSDSGETTSPLGRCLLTEDGWDWEAGCPVPTIFS